MNFWVQCTCSSPLVLCLIFSCVLGWAERANPWHHLSPSLHLIEAHLWTEKWMSCHHGAQVEFVFWNFPQDLSVVLLNIKRMNLSTCMHTGKDRFCIIIFLPQINAFVAYGGWVPRKMGDWKCWSQTARTPKSPSWVPLLFHKRTLDMRWHMARHKINSQRGA